MQNCHLRFELGKPQDHQPAQWLEGEVQISQGHFSMEAHLCARRADEIYSQHSVSLNVAQPFSAEALLDLLALLVEPPFEPSHRDLRLKASGDVPVSNGEIARIVDPELFAASVEPGLPSDAIDEVKAKLGRIERARAIEIGFG